MEHTQHPPGDAALPIVTLGPSDQAAIVQHYMSLSDTELELRLGVKQPDPKLKEQQLERMVGYMLTQPDVPTTWFGTYDSNDPHARRLLMVGSVHLDSVPAEAHAELSLSVVPGARGQGHGKSAIWWALAFAAVKNAPRLRMWFDRGNAALMRLLQSMGIQPRTDRSGGLAEIEVPTAQETIGEVLHKIQQLCDAAHEVIPDALHAGGLMFTPVHPADLDGLVKFYLQFSNQDLALRFPNETFDGPGNEKKLREILGSALGMLEKMQQPHFGFFNVRDSTGKLVAAISFYYVDDDTLEFGLAIEPNSRGQGVREATWSWMLEFARQRKVSTIEGFFAASNIAVKKSLEKSGIPFEIDGDTGKCRIKVVSELDFVQKLIGDIELLFQGCRDILAHRSDPPGGNKPAVAPQAHVQTKSKL